MSNADVLVTDSLIAANAEGVRWADADGKVWEPSGRAYGIHDAGGRWLSSDGVSVSRWGKLTTARHIASDLVLNGSGEDFAPGGVRRGWTWIVPVA